MGAWSHATWMGAAIFDGARAFEGVTPDLDLHCQRAIRSAAALGLASPMSTGQIEEILRGGIAKFPKGTPLYLRPFMWSEDGFMAPDPAIFAHGARVMPLSGDAEIRPVAVGKQRRPRLDVGQDEGVDV